MPDQYRFPYKVVACEGLGVSNSSLRQVGSILPTEVWGQGQLKVFANVATGNTVVQNHAAAVILNGTPFEIGFIYNSFAPTMQQAWRLNVAKQFKPLPSKDPYPPFITLIESDGHETKYTATNDKPPIYVAPGLGEGTPFLHYNPNSKDWVWTDPQTQTTEHYNEQGFIKKRVDAQGRSLEFRYNDKNEVVAIVDDLERCCQIARLPASQEEANEFGVTTKIELRLLSPDGQSQLMQTHYLDNFGRLVRTQTPDPNAYWIGYEYPSDASIRLAGIKQADGTELGFGYGDKSRLTQLWFGNATSSVTTAIDYDGFPPTRVEVSSGTGAVTQFTLDSSKRISQVLEARGYLSTPQKIKKVKDSSGVESEVVEAQQEVKKDQEGTSPLKKKSFLEAKDGDKTQFGYADTGQLSSITRPDNGQEKFEHRNVYGLKTKQIKPNGEVTQYRHDVGDAISSEPKLDPSSMDWDKSELEEKKIAVLPKLVPAKPNLIVTLQPTESSATLCATRRVIDPNYRGLGLSFARFEISPTGKVIEWIPDEFGYIRGVRTYLGQRFPIETLAPESVPSLQAMAEWKSYQDLRKTRVKAIDYDQRGLVAHTFTYAHADEKGIGILDDQTAEECFGWDDWGDLLQHEVTQKRDPKDPSKKTTAVTNQRFDGLRRLITLVDALDQRTDHAYLDAKSQIQTTHPNGRKETTQHNSQGDAIGEVQTAEGQTRNTSLLLDLDSLPVITTHPDGRQTFSFYDQQRRLGYTVSATGIVKEHQYNREKRYRTIIEYDQRVAISDFWPDKRFLPACWLLIEALQKKKDPKKDRQTYEFFDSSGRLVYTVDAKKQLKEIIYGKRDLKAREIVYKKELSDDELKILLQGGTLQRPFDVKLDRFHSWFYDNDDRLTLEQDAGLYITAYERDPDGRVTVKQRGKLDPATMLALDQDPSNILKQLRAKAKKERLERLEQKESKAAAKNAVVTTYYYYDGRHCIAEVDAEGYYTEHTHFAGDLPARSKRLR